MVDFREKLEFVPGTIADPVPYLTKLFDEKKLTEFVKLELEFREAMLETQLKFNKKVKELL